MNTTFRMCYLPYLQSSLGVNPKESFSYHIKMSLAGRDQTVSKPEVVAAQQKEIPEEISAGAKQRTRITTDVVEGSEERGRHRWAGK